MSDVDILASLVDEIRRLLEPLEEALDSSAAFQAFLRRRGWEVPASTLQIDNIRDTIDVAADLAAAVQQLEAAWEKQSLPDVSEISAALDTAKQAIDTVRGLTSRPPPGGLPTALWADVAEQLPEALLIEYLERHHPFVYGVLGAFGVVEEEHIDLAGQPGRVSYVRCRVSWGRLPRVFTEPGKVVREVYAWEANSGPRLAPLIDALGRFLRLTDLPVESEPIGEPWRGGYYSAGNPNLATLGQLRATLLSLDDGLGNSLDVALVLVPVPPRQNPGGTPGGLILALHAAIAGTPPEEMSWPVSVELAGDILDETAVGLELYPGSLRAVAGTLAELDVAFALIYEPSDAVLLVGQPGSHRLQCAKARLGLRIVGPLADLDVEVELALDELELVVESGDADSFLGRILGGKPLTASFDLAVMYSTKRGLHFRGKGALEFEIPINQTMGIADLLSLAIGLRAGSAGVDLSAGVSASAKLGPVGVSVENVGLLAALRPIGKTEPPGLLGDLDLSFGFKPPDGLGIRVNAGPVTGGGFLEIDRANGRYAGILQLRVGVVAITAIGLLDTRLPGGVEGYSFLIIVTAKFSPIQLGFGFTLIGVGGLAGINRTIVVAALQAGVRSHSLDGLLFPEDPARDAPQIISDLRAIFPPAGGRYVFGPMALLGYGSPTLLEAELGIILELPMPLRIVLLGQLNAALPDKKKPVVELHLDVLGILDFGAKLLSIDASLHDSRIAAFNVFGDMAMRLSWGEEPTFVLSVGGFHPAFRAPPEFPQLRRLTVALGEGENPRLMLQTYLAVTSNTFQIGARAELYAEAAGFNLAGWVGFDALFVFSPFSFRTDFSAGFALRRGSTVIAGIHLEATLTGPTPFHAWGEASLSILFFEIKVAFDKTFGVEELVQLALGNPWPLLQGAVEDRRNWSATLPPAVFQVVSLSTPTGAGDEPVLVDPVGGLTLRQKVVPLDRTLTKFGEAPLAAPQRFTVELSQVKVGAGGIPTPGRVRDAFAPAQFEELSDAEKLSRPSFEHMEAGITVASEKVECTVGGGGRGLDATYETVTINAPRRPPTPVDGTYTMSSAQQLSVLGRAAAARSGLLTSGLERFAPASGSTPLAGLEEEQFAVVRTSDLGARPDVLKEPTTKGAAFQALDAWLAGRPEDRGLLQVVPVGELETVA